MGNQLAGMAPSQLLHVEHCLQEVPQIKFEQELGSSRFFKVAKVRTKDDDRSSVVKVFLIPDPSLPIQEYKQGLRMYCQKLVGATNILPYSEIILTDRAAFVLRPFVDHSLYDRITTRPFLTIDEKKWIAFQLLNALVQLHTPRDVIDSKSVKTKQILCHGDIKTENVLLSSWGWLSLADMAPFKPVYLPADNPSEFAFFFDASRRRAGYTAPERFVGSKSQTSGVSTGLSSSASSSALHAAGNAAASQTPTNTYVDPSGEVKAHDLDWSSSHWVGLSFSDDFPNLDRGSLGTGPGDTDSKRQLTPAMDVFSAGCVLLELFTDGTTPFTLSQLLAYRGGDTSRLDDVLNKVQDTNIREMISNMVTASETERVSAQDCLMNQRGKAFPEFYYNYLISYMQKIFMTSITNPDARVCKIRKDLPQIIERQAGDPSGPSALNGSVVLQANVVTAALRSLRTEYAKLEALTCLLELARYLQSDIVLDRIVPHMMEFLTQLHSGEVRRYAVECVAQCVTRITNIQTADVDFFPEYLLPGLSPITQDPDAQVRIAFAQVVDKLAETALRFLDEAQLLRMQSGDPDEKPLLASYDAELHILRNHMRDKVVQLLADRDNRVREALINLKSVTRLVNFFGKMRANDILLPHLITFLNDKDDFHLRCSFFSELASLAHILGSQSTPVLRSLLEQGLLDVEENVIESCLLCLTRLCSLGLLWASLQVQLGTRVIALLGHPSSRIRHSAVLFLVSFANQASLATVYVHLQENATLKAYFKTPVTTFTDERVLLSSLSDPLPRAVFDCAARNPQVGQLLKILEERRHVRSITRARHQPSYTSNETTQESSPLFRKLRSLGMTTPEMEDALLELGPLVRALASFNLDSSAPSALLVGSQVATSTNSSPFTSVHAEALLAGEVSRCTLPAPSPLIISLAYQTPVSTPLSSNAPASSMATSTASSNAAASVRGMDTSSSSANDPESNKEWQHMFSSSHSGPPSQDSSSSRPSTSKSSQSKVNPRPSSPLPTKGRHNQGSGQSGNISRPGTAPQLNTSPGGAMDTSAFLNVPSGDQYIRQYEELMRNRLSTGAIRVNEMSDSFHWVTPPVAAPCWKPKGILVAHLHEHKVGHVSLLAHHSGQELVSCGAEGTVKLWDCGMSGIVDPTSNRYLPAKSFKTYSAGKACKYLVWTDYGQGVATVSDASTLHVVDRSTGVARSISSLHDEKLGKCLYLCAPRSPLSSSGRSMSAPDAPLVVYTTTGGVIAARDLRCPPSLDQYAWKLHQDKEHGMMVSLVVHGCHTWLVTGSSRGSLVCWDLRYQRSISHATHPNKALFYRLALHPVSCPVSVNASSDSTGAHLTAEQSNTAPQILASCDKNNEVSCWDLETSTRLSTLWASHTPIFSSKSGSVHSVRSFIACSGAPSNSSQAALATNSAKQSVFMITGGTDHRLRFWDLACLDNSSMIALRGVEEHLKSLASITYRTQVVEGTEVHMEHLKIPPTKNYFKQSEGDQSKNPLVEDVDVQMEQQSFPDTKNSFLEFEMNQMASRQPTKGHVNSIADLAIIEAGQPFLVSSSCDGVIKIWK